MGEVPGHSRSIPKGTAAADDSSYARKRLLFSCYQPLLILDDVQGFLSLAQANFNNNSGVRYGQDYYDGRMQATRKM